MYYAHIMTSDQSPNEPKLTLSQKPFYYASHYWKILLRHHQPFNNDLPSTASNYTALRVSANFASILAPASNIVHHIRAVTTQ